MPRPSLVPAIALLAALLACPESAIAQLSLEPSVKVVEARANSEASYEITVKNAGDRELPCTVVAVPASMTEQGRLVPSADDQRSAARWLTLEPSAFTLAKQSSERVKVTIRPTYGAAGGYSAMIGCRVPPAAAGAEAGAGVAMGLRVYGVLLVTVPGRTFRVKTAAGEVQLRSNDAGRLEVSSVLQNDSDVHLFVSGKATLRTATGVPLVERAFPKASYLVLAGLRRRFTLDLGQPPADGVYTAMMEYTGPRGMRLAGVSETYTVSGGQISPGRPTPEQEAALLASQPRFALSVRRAHHDIPPGGRRSDRVEILNVASEDITVVPELMFWDLDDSADLCFGTQAPSHGRAGTEFISLRPTSLALRPRQKGVLVYSIALPRDASGEYFPAIVFHEADRRIPADARLARQSTVVLSVAAQGTCRRAIELSAPRFSAGAQGGGKLGFTLKCAGNAGVEYEGSAQVIGPGGVPTGDAQVFGGEGSVLLPGCQVSMELDIPNRLEPGQYTAEISAWPLGRNDDAVKLRHAFAAGQQGPAGQ